MSLDATARLANVQDSLKRFFRETFYVGKNIPVMFDKSLATPKLQGHEVDRWIALHMGSPSIEALARQTVTIYCCARKDAEGFKVAQLRDTVFEQLVDSSVSHGMGQIELFRSYRDEEWDSIGFMLVQIDYESEQLETDDETKYRYLVVSLRWGAKVG